MPTQPPDDDDRSSLDFTGLPLNPDTEDTGTRLSVKIDPTSTRPSCMPSSMKEKSCSEKKWREKLTAEEYEVTRQAGTEPAFSGRYLDTKTPGTYECVCCGQVLFDSRTKYDSGTGWPSFYAPVNESFIVRRTDKSLGRVRTEVVCSACDAHLGHVFPDGPPPTGERFCMNSLALRLKLEPQASTILDNDAD